MTPIDAVVPRDAAPAAAPDAVAGRHVVVLSSEDEIRALAPQWEAMRPSPSAHPEAVLSVARSRASILRPHVFAMLRGAKLEALFVARLEEHDYRCKFGWHVLYRRSIRALTVEYGGALRAHPGVPWEPLVAALAGSLRAGVASAAHVRRLECGSELLDSMRAGVGRAWRNESEAPVPHWCLDLPESYEALLSRVCGKTRQVLRRSRRVVERAFPGRVVFRRTTAPADVRAFCVRAESVARGTYQRGIDAGFVHDAEYEERLLLAARHGRLRAYELEVDGRVRSFWIGEVLGGTHYLDSTGYAGDFGRFSPGKVLRMEVLRDAIDEGVKRVDFGFGDAEYKRQFDARCREERDVYLFAPGLSGAWLNGARGGVTLAADCAKAVVERVRVRDSLRRMTRRAAEKRMAAEFDGASEPAAR